MCLTLFSDGLKVAFEALVVAHPEGQQHDIGGGDDGDGAGHRVTQAAAQRHTSSPSDLPLYLKQTA